MYFTFSNCGSLVGSNRSPLGLRRDPAKWGKYLAEGQDSTSISTSTLKSTDGLVRDLAEEESFYSLGALRELLEVRSVLKEKIRLAERSLEDIFEKK
jgi:hypothetical protein